jgi:putative tricarboxylic transport membrane protein
MKSATEKARMKNLADMVGSLILVLVGIVAMIEAIRLHVGTPTEPQPGFFPFLSGAFIFVLSSIILVQGWLGRGDREVKFGEVRRPALLVVVLIAFVAVLESLGYLIASLIIVALALRIMGIRSWRVLLTTSFAMSIGTFVLFDRLLGIALPVGILSRFGL